MEDNYNIVIFFCHTSTWTGHRCTCIPSILNRIPPPSPPDPSRLSQSPGFGCQESPSVVRSPIAVWGIRGLSKVISPSSLRVWFSLGRGCVEAGNAGPHPNTLMSGFRILAFLAGFADRLVALRGQLLLALITSPGRPGMMEDHRRNQLTSNSLLPGGGEKPDGIGKEAGWQESSCFFFFF